MGILTSVIIYKLGKRRGRKQASTFRSFTPRPTLNHGADEECVNYARFCRAYGSCDGQVCEYD